jgi:hypothetical protein
MIDSLSNEEAEALLEEKLLSLAGGDQACRAPEDV